MLGRQVIDGEQLDEDGQHGKVERPISLQNEGVERVSSALEGSQERAHVMSGAAESPHVARRRRTSSCWSARESLRSCRLSAAMPPPTAFDSFPHVEQLLF